MWKLRSLQIIVVAVAFIMLLRVSIPPVASQSPTPSPPDDEESRDGVTAPAEGFIFNGAFVTNWSRSAAQRINLTEENTIPMVIRSDEPIARGIYLWDFWPLMNPQGEVAVIDGWVVIMGLTAEIDEIPIPGARHEVATWRYFYRRAGSADWIPGGRVFPEGTALGDRQWAGSAFYNPQTGRATFYYTALGQLPEVVPDTERNSGLTHQAMVSTTAAIRATVQGVSFTEFSDHEPILLPDGEIYATAAQSANVPGAHIFRDPFYFIDPQTGEEFMLFSATAAFAPQRANAVAGLARRVGGEWQLLPPVLGAIGVNSQVERPHVIVRDGLYYLFFTSHTFSFVDGLTGPEGLYGFASDALRGHYAPLNGSGLVLGNPEVAPLQTYSYMVLPGGEVLSFINYVYLGDVTLETLDDQTPEFQHEHFGGSPAPVLHIAIEGVQTRLEGTHLEQ